jgi:murein L,D-transpeptidase YafK
MSGPRSLSFKKVIKLVLLVSLVPLLALRPGAGFKETQVKYARVKNAYTKKWDGLKKTLKDKGIDKDNFEVHLRNFKYEKELELWARNKGDQQYKLIKTFKICASSGSLGPKRKEGDYQVPEGFYEVNWFNPMSDYHLGLKVNYPNQSDRIKARGNRPGGDIMIHGNCVTIGCIPIENEPIEELYVVCVETKNYNNPITLSMYPCRFTEQNWTTLSKNDNKEHIKFWGTLKIAYEYFEKNKTMPKIKIDKAGDYSVES